MRIAYYSVSPVVSSGYGVCTKELVYRLLSEHDVVVYAYYGVQKSVIPGVLDGKYGGRNVLIVGGDGSIAHPLLPEDQDNYDLIIAHFDVWMLEGTKYLDRIHKPFVWWVIMDHVPTPIPTVKVLSRKNVYGVPITRWARDQMVRDGVPEGKLFDNIYHGIDLDKWKPVKTDEVVGFPEGAEFVVVSVVANLGYREAIPLMVEGFAKFLRETGADAYYYIHADPYPEPRSFGYDLPEVVSQVQKLYDVDLRGRIYFKGRWGYVSERSLMAVYSRADVQLLTVMGGAFELPILEAGACGTPTISTDFSGMTEVIGEDRGILVPPRAWFWNNLTSAKQAVPHPDDIAEALRVYYDDPKLRKKHVDNLLAWIRRNATWDIVAKRWLEVIDDVGGGV